MAEHRDVGRGQAPDPMGPRVVEARRMGRAKVNLRLIRMFYAAIAVLITVGLVAEIVGWLRGEPLASTDFPVPAWLVFLVRVALAVLYARGAVKVTRSPRTWSLRIAVVLTAIVAWTLLVDVVRGAFVWEGLLGPTFGLLMHWVCVHFAREAQDVVAAHPDLWARRPTLGVR